MKLLRRSLIGVALVALVATGCAADESDAEPVEESAPSDVEESAPSDIVDVAIAAEQFPTLVAALQAAGLVDTLKGEGPFTVFAPT
ncbi:MAG: fasciclin domain-containing protein, partial [Actinomycetota bacterium]|nr:fasciclin domain-containing protein [Actinomycetota bacterium]